MCNFSWYFLEWMICERVCMNYNQMVFCKKKLFIEYINVDTIFCGIKGPIPIISSDFNIKKSLQKKRQAVSLFWQSVIKLFILQNRPIKTLYLLNMTFWLDVSRIRVKKTPTQKVLLCTHTTKSPNRNTMYNWIRNVVNKKILSVIERLLVVVTHTPCGHKTYWVWVFLLVFEKHPIRMPYSISIKKIRQVITALY
jgi:hypothetical protein